MSTCGRIFIEFCLLNTGRSHKTKIAKNITVLLSREKGKGGGSGWNLDFMEGSVKDKSSLPWEALHHFSTAER